jgi:hypothetical protein
MAGHDLNAFGNSPTRRALPLRDTGPLSADLLPADLSTNLTERDFALARPSEAFDPLHRPVRGDLAHIRCAGRIFVPHYAVPMPHVLTGEARLARAGRADAEALAVLVADTPFNVLDIAGGWAWGQVGEDGLVGYVPMAALVAL